MKFCSKSRRGLYFLCSLQNGYGKRDTHIRAQIEAHSGSVARFLMYTEGRVIDA